MSTDTLTFTPYYSQALSDGRFYGHAEYRGQTVEVYEKSPGIFVWAYYVRNGRWDDLPIARSDDTFPSIETATADATDYIDGNLG